MKEIGHMVQPQKEATIRLKALKNLIVGCLHYVPPLKLIIERTGNEGANPPHVTLSMLQVTKVTNIHPSRWAHSPGGLQALGVIIMDKDHQLVLPYRFFRLC